jgi:hypothetical protein
MRARNPLILGAFLGAFPMAAAAWDHSIERGLDLYQARDGGVSVALVCDPNSVYGRTSQSGVLLNLSGNVDASLPVTFRFPDGMAVQAELVHGRVGKADMEAGAWTSLLDGFRSNAAVTLEIGDATSRPVELGEPVMFTCV